MRNELLDEIKHDFIGDKQEIVYRVSNYFENILFSCSCCQFLGSNSCICFTNQCSSIASSAVGIKIFAITARIKRYKQIIKTKRKKLDKIVLLAKAKLNTIEVLISKVLSDLYFSHDKFISVYNILREYNEMKE